MDRRTDVRKAKSDFGNAPKNHDADKPVSCKKRVISVDSESK
jgi:hypothetical protein